MSGVGGAGASGEGAAGVGLSLREESAAETSRLAGVRAACGRGGGKEGGLTIRVDGAVRAAWVCAAPIWRGRDGVSFIRDRHAGHIA